MRCTQTLGLTIADLEWLTVGMVMDMLIEQANDSAEDAYDTIREATQADYDRF